MGRSRKSGRSSGCAPFRASPSGLWVDTPWIEAPSTWTDRGRGARRNHPCEVSTRGARAADRVRHGRILSRDPGESRFGFVADAALQIAGLREHFARGLVLVAGAALRLVRGRLVQFRQLVLGRRAPFLEDGLERIQYATLEIGVHGQERCHRRENVPFLA